MRRSMVLWFAVSGIFLGSTANGQDDDKHYTTVFLDKAPLTVGDPAPKLTVQEFLRGKPVKHFEKGKIYVVEFWKYH